VALTARWFGVRAAIVLLVALLFGVPYGFVRWRQNAETQRLRRQVDLRRRFQFGPPCGYAVWTSLLPKHSADPGSDANTLIEPYHGLSAEFVAGASQSFLGYSLCIGDVDADGRDELVCGTASDSRLYVLRYDDRTGGFHAELVAEGLAGGTCNDARTDVAGAVGCLLVTDVNGDRVKEIVAMTDQHLEDRPMRFWVFSWKGDGWFRESVQVDCPSHWTQGLGALDTDGDGVEEVFSLHEGGEAFRLEVSEDLRYVSIRPLVIGAAKGLSLELADLFGNGRPQLVAVVKDETGRAEVRIYEPTEDRDLQRPVTSIRNAGRRRFGQVAACAADLDGEGRAQVIVAASFDPPDEDLTLTSYRFGRGGHLLGERTLARFEGAARRGFPGLAMEAGHLGRGEGDRLYIFVNQVRVPSALHSTEQEPDWGLYEVALTGMLAPA